MLDEGRLETISKKIRRYGARGLNEQNTKSGLIEPLLEILDWDLRDIDEVEREYSYRDGRGSYRIDYALRTEPRSLPALLIEAKALGQNLEDGKWWRQVVHYASDCGVDWAVLTDGDRYLIFRANAQGPIDQRLFKEVQVTRDETRTTTCDILNLLSKSALAEAEINRRWDAWRIGTMGRDALRKLVAEKDDSLVRLIVRRTTLTKGEAERFLESERGTLFDGAVSAEAAAVKLCGSLPKPSAGRKLRTTATNPRHRQPKSGGRQHPEKATRRRHRKTGSQAGSLDLPRQDEIALPLLHALAARGGRTQPSEKIGGLDLYEELGKHFRLPPATLVAMRPDGRTPVWRNVVQWARQALVTSGHLDSRERGVWRLTAKGRRAASRGRL